MITLEQRRQLKKRRQYRLTRKTKPRLSSLLRLILGLQWLWLLALIPWWLSSLCKRLSNLDDDFFRLLRKWGGAPDYHELVALEEAQRLEGHFMAHQGEIHYVPGVGLVTGDPSCRYNARSWRRRCTANLIGTCAECSRYKIDFQYLMTRCQAMR
jgi:hypothetical protein